MRLDETIANEKFLRLSVEGWKLEEDFQVIDKWKCPELKGEVRLREFRFDRETPGMKQQRYNRPRDRKQLRAARDVRGRPNLGRATGETAQRVRPFCDTKNTRSRVAPSSLLQKPPTPPGAAWCVRRCAVRDRVRTERGRLRPRSGTEGALLPAPTNTPIVRNRAVPGLLGCDLYQLNRKCEFGNQSRMTSHLHMKPKIISRKAPRLEMGFKHHYF